jgi:hypothetical protein
MTFRRTTLILFSGSKSTPSKLSARRVAVKFFGFQFILTSKNVGKHPAKYTRRHIPEDNNLRKYPFRRMGMILTAS